MKTLNYSILLFFFVFSSYSQNKTSKSEFLNDFAVCDCITMAYYKTGIKLNDASGNYWREASILSRNEQEIFDDFIESYVNKMKLNQAFDGSTCVINYCLGIKKDKDFKVLIKKLISRKKM
jgi:hypothetical protein